MNIKLILSCVAVAILIQDANGAANHVICAEAPMLIADANLFTRMTVGPNDKMAVSRNPINPATGVAGIPANCLPQERTGVTHAKFNLTMLQTCGAYVAESATHINFTYTVRKIPNYNTSFVIHRYKDSCMNFTCSFIKKYTLNSTMLVPVIEKIKLAGLSGEGAFKFSFGFFNSTTFQSPLTGNPPTVQVPDYVFVQAKADGLQANFILQGMMCWATHTSSPSDSKRYDLIQNGCRAPVLAGDAANSIEILKNYNSTEVQFKFKSFTWTNVSIPMQAIYIHCMVSVCDININSTCNQHTCVAPIGRRRRDVSENYKGDHLVSSGPLYFKKPNPCAFNNGGCYGYCNDINGFAKCSCPFGSTLGADQVTCMSERKSSEWTVDSPVAMFALFLVALTVFLVYYYRK
uniref:alpha-tectorin-like isoform X2 n=1 Tax=Ciona intestinalis TaxID=7719 RepID=UPI000EF45689|nr:alpha-tectorin-like isoform X2 [Ciona intestinalis]|eukprot:XP_026694582.1 alpha-tectorin-like isoform X2 [Ciona intestinalis]